MAMFGWVVLFLVFVDEIVAIAALWDWGWHQGGFWVALLCAAVSAVVWWLFAAPGARLGDRFTRPIVKVAVFLLASAALWSSGHETLALVFLGFSVAVHALAQLPSVKVLVD